MVLLACSSYFYAVMAPQATLVSSSSFPQSTFSMPSSPQYSFYTNDFNVSLGDINITDIVDNIIDVFWDYDNTHGGGGLLVVAFSYIPFLGSNGNQTIQIIFYLLLAGGVIVVTNKVVRR